MSTTATVDTNKGWTFAGCSRTSEFPITTSTDIEQTKLPTNEPNNDWGIAATTTDGWNAPPAAPSPPMSAVGQPRTDDHASLHWTACYDDYCNTHRQSKDNHYYPRHSRRRRRTQTCDCPLPHPDELITVTHERRLNPVKACADWHRGKRVCPECQFLVNMENHHLRCSAAALRNPLADITNPQEDQEPERPTDQAAAPHAGDQPPLDAAPTSTTLQDEQLTLLGDIVTMIHQTITRDARRNDVVHRTLAQRMNELHDADQQRLQGMTRVLAEIVKEQQRLNEQLQARQQASRPVRIYRTPIRRRAAPTRHDLAGASVWTGDVLSRISRDRLVSAAAGAAVTLAALWLGLITAAATTIILRA